MGKIAVVEAADVERTRRTLDDVARGLQKILRQLQTVCKVVRAAGGNVGNGRFAPDGVKAGDDFVERAVAHVHLAPERRSEDAHIRAAVDDERPRRRARQRGHRHRPTGGEAQLAAVDLQRMAAAGGWAVLDELGYLESGCADFQQSVLDMLKGCRVLAVVRKQDTPFLRALCADPDAFVYDLDCPVPNAGPTVCWNFLGKVNLSRFAHYTINFRSMQSLFVRSVMLYRG